MDVTSQYSVYPFIPHKSSVFPCEDYSYSKYQSIGLYPNIFNGPQPPLDFVCVTKN